MVHDLAISAIPPHWTVTTLGQYLDINGGTIQTGPFGSQLHASDYVEQGIPSVMPKNITVEKIDDSDIARISVEDAERLSKYLLQSGDIIYSRRGDVEKCSLVTDVENGWLCGTGCLRVRLNCEDKDKLSKFLHAYLSSPMIREWISRNAVGATMPNLNTSILRDVPLIIPESYKIDFIGSMWTRFNNKITLNRQINQTLEQMAQALFKSWFVDFDPVVDNALDSGFFEQNSDLPEELLRRAEQRKIVRKQPDFKPLPAETRQLFPAAFEECEEPSLGLGGWVPKGWNIKKVENLIELVYGKALKSTDRIDGPVPVYGSGGITGYHSESLVDGPSIIVGRKGTVGSLYWEDRPFFPIDTVFYVRSEKPLTYCFYLLHTLGLADMNTDAAVPGLNRNNAYRLQVITPNDDLLNTFDTFTTTLRERIFANSEQLTTLINLRDNLLPKLISGDLRLDKIEVAR
ncbi:MAG: restriction endonuclease subunit S [Plesiomonas sp.]